MQPAGLLLEYYGTRKDKHCRWYKIRPSVHLLSCANSEGGIEEMLFDDVEERGIDSIYI